MDLLVQLGNTIVPVEVKSGTSVDSPSLRYYARRLGDVTPPRVRLSMRNLLMGGDFLNVPLYLADRAVSFMERALLIG